MQQAFPDGSGRDRTTRLTTGAEIDAVRERLATGLAAIDKAERAIDAPRSA